MWSIELSSPQWGVSLYCQRQFQTPEAATCYAQSLIEIPEIWVAQEGALCHLLEACDPDSVEIKIRFADPQAA